MPKDVEQAEVRPPFRIMPSRQRDLVLPGALALIGLALLVGGVGSASGKTTGGGLELVAVVGGICLAPIGLRWLLKERRYFDPRNEYWIEIGIDAFALVTPDAIDRSKWSDLTPFEVKQVVTQHQFKHGRTKSVTFETVTCHAGLEIKIPLDDFATRLGAERHNRAVAMRAVLEDLRQRALTGWAEEPFLMPSGLVIAPIPSQKPPLFSAAKSVVRRG